MEIQISTSTNSLRSNAKTSIEVEREDWDSMDSDEKYQECFEAAQNAGTLNIEWESSDESVTATVSTNKLNSGITRTFDVEDWAEMDEDEQLEIVLEELSGSYSVEYTS